MWLEEIARERLEEIDDPELGEASTIEISKKRQPHTLKQKAKVAQNGGSVAAVARKQLEKETGKKIITKLNAKNLKQAPIETDDKE